MAIKYVCRCRKCNNVRESYNDPRARKSVIECKASCFESHYEWELVDEFQEGEPVAAADSPLVLSPPAPAATAPPPPSAAKGECEEVSSPTPKAKQAFGGDDTGPSEIVPASPQDKKSRGAESELENGSSGKKLKCCVML